MKNVGTGATILCFLAVIFLGPTSSAQSQDLFRDMEQVKKELSDLRNEVNDLRELVYGLRKAVLKSVSTPDQQTTDKVPPQQDKVEKQNDALDEKQLTKVICRAVGKFFSDAEAILRSDDTPAAERGMRKALQNLNSALRGYEKTHRGSKLLAIYEGLAWDAYVAVELRQSVAGNEQFLESLRKHKQKYIETCPKD